MKAGETRDQVKPGKNRVEVKTGENRRPGEIRAVSQFWVCFLLLFEGYLDSRSTYKTLSVYYQFIGGFMFLIFTFH